MRTFRPPPLPKGVDLCDFKSEGTTPSIQDRCPAPCIYNSSNLVSIKRRSSSKSKKKHKKNNHKRRRSKIVIRTFSSPHIPKGVGLCDFARVPCPALGRAAPQPLYLFNLVSIEICFVVPTSTLEVNCSNFTNTMHLDRERKCLTVKIMANTYGNLSFAQQSERTRAC